MFVAKRVVHVWLIVRRVKDVLDETRLTRILTGLKLTIVWHSLTPTKARIVACNALSRIGVEGERSRQKILSVYVRRDLAEGTIVGMGQRSYARFAFLNALSGNSQSFDEGLFALVSMIETTRLRPLGQR